MSNPADEAGIGESGPGIITEHLRDWQEGDATALDHLTNAVYRELRRMASSILSGHAAQLTLQPTVLVNELYLQLPGVQRMEWQSRAHFLNAAAKMMRHILVDHARQRLAAKRGPGLQTVIADPQVNDPSLQIDVLLINECLERFAERHPRQARVVELRFFGGLTTLEISEVLSTGEEAVSTRTVERDWVFARAWLQRAIADHPAGV